MSGNPSAYHLDDPYHLGDPLWMTDARLAARASRQRVLDAEKEYNQAVDVSADAVLAYRKGMAREFLLANGPVTERELVAKAECAELEHVMNIAAGMVRSADHRLKGLEGERAMLRQLIEWSAKMLGQS